MSPSDLLAAWLRRQLPADAFAWLSERLERCAAATADDRPALVRSIALVPRTLGRTVLELSPADLATADAVRPNWNPSGWRLDEAARVLLVLATAPSAFGTTPFLRAVLAPAALPERIALLRGLPLYSDPAAALSVAQDGIRSAIAPVFEAVAHHNPYPAEQFDETGWNQMVLKALFIGSTLAPVQGLVERGNPTLVDIMLDYAAERWAAGRTVSPELWREVGPWLAGSRRARAARLLDIAIPAERDAARAALGRVPSR